MGHIIVVCVISLAAITCVDDGLDGGHFGLVLLGQREWAVVMWMEEMFGQLTIIYAVTIFFATSLIQVG